MEGGHRHKNKMLIQLVSFNLWAGSAQTDTTITFKTYRIDGLPITVMIQIVSLNGCPL